MRVGEIVAKKKDPVHRGQVVRIDLTNKLINVRWSPYKILECQILEDELMLAKEWKDGVKENAAAKLKAKLKGKSK